MDPKTITALSHAVAFMLRDDVAVNESNRFASMELCQEILARMELVHESDRCMPDTLRSWIGKVQEKFQG